MRTIEEINKGLACKANCSDCQEYQHCEESFDGFCDDVLTYTSLLDGIPLDRLREICAAERDGRCVVLPEGWSVGMINRIMSICERVRATKLAKGQQDEPIITWQLYNLLVQQSRAEANAALKGGTEYAEK